ncbi:MAG: hypothetical protein V1934_00115 [Methanobacteriota archaeon]
MVEKGERFHKALKDIQPTQLYISTEKLANVVRQLGPSGPFEYEPVPVRELNGRLIYSDGHTRAFALHRLGAKEILCCWEDEPLDWDEYEVCVEWCLAEGIRTIAGLEGRVVEPDAYQRLWLDRCGEMHQEMARKRLHANRDKSKGK